MNILSIQSHVVYGHVGHQASTFPLQRLGHEVWALPTVLYSNHLAKASFTGRKLDAHVIDELVSGLRDLELLSRLDAVLTGYLGDAPTVPVAIAALEIARADRPDVVFACDPVMGDDGALYVSPALAEAIGRELVPRADILFPNIFELQHLTGMTVTGLKDVRPAMEALRKQARQALIVATGIPDEEHKDLITALALDDSGFWQAKAKRHPMGASGNGDCFAALFLGRYLGHRDIPTALGNAVEGMSKIAALTAATNADELRIVESQEVWSKLDPDAVAKRIG
ncbi:MAG TPA: pyridoxal kinase [Candidatus Binatia bacterium]|nr:pyridoxal kinase [Candidatus Binatia bacterium]